MDPKSISICNVNTKDSYHQTTDTEKQVKKKNISLFNFETEIIWHIVLKMTVLHAIGIYGILTFDYMNNPMTTLWTISMYIISNFGVSGGAHRFWAHKSYKAKLPLRILLLVCYSTSAQKSIRNWVKNHRMHHKYCDTNADPHNTERGYFYAHIGWVMMKEHPEFIEKSKKLDVSDIMSDPIVVFDDKYFLPLQLFFGFILPTVIPVYFWNETWARAIISQIFIRHIMTSNSVWAINSIAHSWGMRPYDKTIKPSDNAFVNFLTIGDGHHNYHHVFPCDYRSVEIGNNGINCTTFLIDIFAKLGLAYDLKYPSADMIRKTVLKKGDGTHRILSEVDLRFE